MLRMIHIYVKMVKQLTKKWFSLRTHWTAALPVAMIVEQHPHKNTKHLMYSEISERSIFCSSFLPRAKKATNAKLT